MGKIQLVALVIAAVIPNAVMASPEAQEAHARMNAVNRALEQALSERAKSQKEFERNMAAGRSREQVRESWMTRKQQQSEQQERAGERMAAHSDRLDKRDSRQQRYEERDLREETRRQRRLNWLND